jgi:hypothetical protein
MTAAFVMGGLGKTSMVEYLCLHQLPTSRLLDLLQNALKHIFCFLKSWSCLACTVIIQGAVGVVQSRFLATMPIISRKQMTLER